MNKLISSNGKREDQISSRVFLFSIITATLILFQPTQTWGQSTAGANNTTNVTSPATPTTPSSTQSSVKLANCFLNAAAQSTDKTEMDNVIAGSVVATYILHKENLACKISPTQIVMAEITIYGRLTDNLQTQNAIDRNIEVRTCIKDSNGFLISCVSEEPPEDLPSEIQCVVKKPYRSSPVIMNTETGSGNMSTLTIKAEADPDVYTCRDANNNQLLKNTVMFTITFDDLNVSKVLKKNPDYLTCLTDLVTAKVLACNFQQIA